MLSRIILAVLVAVIVYIACLFVGGVLFVQLLAKIPAAVAVGHFLVDWAVVISVIAGLWQFFAGGFSFPKRA